MMGNFGIGIIAAFIFLTAFGIIAVIIGMFVVGIASVSNRLALGTCSRLTCRQKNPAEASFCRRCGMPVSMVGVRL
jgi:hypothetical protein